MLNRRTQNIKIVYFLLIFVPIVTILLKHLFYIGYVYGDNFFELNIGRGISMLGGDLLLPLLIFGAIFSLTFLFKREGKFWFLLTLSIIFSLIYLFMLVYLRSFNVIPSINMISLATRENNDLPSTIDNMVWPVAIGDMVLILDILVCILLIIVYYKLRKSINKNHSFVRYGIVPIGKRLGTITSIWVSVTVIIGMSLPIIYHNNRNNSFFRTEPSNMAMLYTPIGFYLYDAIEIAKGDNVRFYPHEKEDLEKFYLWNQEDYHKNDYFGMYKDKNIIILQIESFESFVIGNQIFGQEITPNINKLLGKSLAFKNIHEQVMCGNSSDCDFVTLTSMYPGDRFTSAIAFENNTLNSFPHILNNNGYKTNYFGAVEGSVWNYERFSKTGLRFQHADFDYDRSDKINTYISDASYLSQTLDKLEALGQGKSSSKLYSHLVLTSSHAPFKMPKEYQYLTLEEEFNRHPVGRYMQAVAYTDRAIGQFLEDAESRGLLDNTIVVLMGDHLGLHKYYPNFADGISEKYKQDYIKESYENTIPFIIYDKEAKSGAEFDVIGGQVDIMPTLLYLLGQEFDSYKDTAMGRSLVATNRNYALGAAGRTYGQLTQDELNIVMKIKHLSTKLLRTNGIKPMLSK